MTWFVPGRIEVFGKHTDYAGGRSLLVASEQGVVASATDISAAAGTLEAVSTASDDVVVVQAGQKADLPAGHWGNYVQTVLDRLTLNFGDLKPARVEVDSTLPLASGMSSSSALIVALALALADHNDLWSRTEWQQNIQDRLDLAGYAATIENGADFRNLKGSRGVGTFGGSQDHTGMLNSVQHSLTPFSFSPLTEYEPIAIPEGWTFAVAVSGVLAEKTGAALESYNAVSGRVSELVAIWNSAHGSQWKTLAQVLESDEDGAEKLARLLMDNPETAARPDLMERLLAYIVEVGEAIPAAEAALRIGDIESFGVAADVSHKNAAENLHNQIPETNALQRIARELGAGAASAFGAGFGGSVWALVPRSKAEEFSERWLENYLLEFPEWSGSARVLLTEAGPSAHRI